MRIFSTLLFYFRKYIIIIEKLDKLTESIDDLSRHIDLLLYKEEVKKECVQ